MTVPPVTRSSGHVWDHGVVSTSHPDQGSRLTTEAYLAAAPAEITSESTFETDTTTKRVQYAAAGIPGYLVVHFEKDWSKISEIEEYRLDWSGRRYVVQAVHRRALVLDEPFRLTVAFEDLQLP
jgi:Putative restriction endonuclease